MQFVLKNIGEETRPSYSDLIKRYLKINLYDQNSVSVIHYDKLQFQDLSSKHIVIPVCAMLQPKMLNTHTLTLDKLP